MPTAAALGLHRRGRTTRRGHLPAPSSVWLDACDDDARGHWIESQAKRVLGGKKALANDEARDKKGKRRIYVLTAFKLVSERMRDMLRPRFGDETAKEMCGTVHRTS